MRAPLKKDFTHDCSSPEEGCQNLINAVFHQAYNDLVRSFWRDINQQIIINRAYVESGADFSKLRDGDER